MYHMLLIKFTELDQQLAYRFDLKERIQVIFHNQTLCNKIVLGRSVECSRTKLAALYSATKSLQNSCTAKLQLFSSLLEAKQQLHSSCSGMQKRCAAFEGSLKLSAAVLQRSCRLSNAAK